MQQPGPSTADPRVPAREDCVAPYLLDRFARTAPDKTFAVFPDGDAWSYRRSRDLARSTAAGLAANGLAPGAHLLCWLPNNALALRCFIGAGYAGAVYVGINTAYKGTLLEHVLDIADAEVMVAHPDLVDRLLEIDRRGALKTVFTAPGKAQADAARFERAGLRLLPTTLLDAPHGELAAVDLAPWSPQSICFTSGTTGPSKAVLSSYLHLHTMGVECLDGIGPDDRYIVNLPLFHAGGTLAVAGSLARGAAIVLLDGFQTDTFFDTCRRTGATASILLGAMAGFLMKRPPSAADRDHALRLVMILPLGDDAAAFTQRFGAEVMTVFNMSEVSCPIRSGRNPTLRGSCGQVRAGVEVRIVDAHDAEVPLGQVGELIVRTDAPWTMFSGYHRMPEATALAWRNGWFHTGDAFRADADGNHFFVDRVKDSIRRRGENISSFELECEVMRFPGLLEAAAVGVRSDDSEDDVLVAVVPQPGTAIDPVALFEHLCRLVPHFMVPRYVRTMAALPKTPTAKVEKHVLRREGAVAGTWDREAAGLRVKRDRLR